MRKVIKILANFLSAIILLLIFLPMLVALIVEIPSVQNFIVGKLTRTLAENTGVNVNVGHVRVDLLGRVSVEEFYVEDLQQDTLLYAGRVRTSLASFVRSSDGNGVVLDDGLIEDTRLFIRETPEGVTNVKQVLDRLSKKKKKKKPFQVDITDARIENLFLVIERQQHRNPEYGIDYGNMRIGDISADVRSFHLQGTVVEGSVSNMVGREQSGFEIKNMDGDFHIDKGVVDLKNMHVQTECSNLYVERLLLKDSDWPRYKDFIHNVPMLGVIRNSSVATDDVAYFAPKMRQWNNELLDADIDFSGLVADLTVNVHRARFGDKSSISGDVNLIGLPDIKNTTLHLDLNHLTTTEEDAYRLFHGMTQKNLPENLLAMLQRAGTITIEGNFDGDLRTFATDASLKTSIGSANVAVSKFRQYDENGRAQDYAFKATADVEKLSLDKLLAAKILGDVTLQASFDGVVASDKIEGDVTADVASIGFNGYDFRNIAIGGFLANKSFRGSVSSADPSLKMSLSGTANLNDVMPVYNLVLDLDHADLHAININHRDSLSTLSMKAELYAVGNDLDDMNGDVTLRDVTYRYNEDTLRTADVELTARRVGEQRSMSLESEFFDATFTGPTRYAEVLGYLTTAMHKYLPGLPPFTDEYVAQHNQGYSALSLSVKKIDPLLAALVDDLQVAEESTLNFMINPSTNHISVRMKSQYLEKTNKVLATNVNVNVNNEGDSLAMYVNSEDLYVGSLNFPNLSIVAGAKNDKLGVSAVTKSEQDSLMASVNLLAKLGYNAQHRRSVTVDVLPTTISKGHKSWNIHRSQVVLDSMRIDVKDFVVSNHDQQLRLNGVASRSIEDSLTLTLRDFSLTPFTTIVERLGYHVNGDGNGVATMKAVLDMGELTANIDIDNISVNDVPVAPMKLGSQWDFKENKANVRLRNMRANKDVIRGYYEPSEKRYYAEGEFDNIPMMMIDSMLRGVVCSTEGTATARLTIAGKGRMAHLNGDIEVRDLSTMAEFTQVRYHAPTAHIDVKDNHLLANDIRVYDEENNWGMYKMDVNLEHLSNVAFNVRVEPRKMIVLNTTAEDNDLFYGKLYASGVASFTGNKSGTRLNISGSTEGDSHFYMPLSSKTDASTADFVTFVKPGGQRPDSTDNLAQKKRDYQRRNNRASASTGNMEINIELEANTNTEAQLIFDPTVGDIIKARGVGSLNLKVVPKANIFEMYGDYEITEGSYLFTLQNIVNKYFDIEEGSLIRWTGDPMNANLDINAVYRLRASLQPLLASTTLDNVTRAVPVECIINLTDRLSNPTVNFDIRVPNADAEIQAAVANLLNNQQSIATQFMYLLVSGSFYSDATSSTMGATASATTGFELLSNQLSNWLSSDDYNIVLRYRPRSELTSDEIDFGFSKSLVNNRLLVELEGNYMVDNKMAANNNMSNFMGEAYITWLIDRAGSLKLKGFTQTIDRFDENQGLQETGLGIYYKEDFNNWADLKRRVSERFMSKRRREARDKAMEAMENGEPYDSTALMTRKELRELRRQERKQKKVERDSLKNVKTTTEINR